MEKLTANILFSGLGMQERGIMNTNLFDLDVLTTSDIDKEAIVSYAVMHNGLNKEMIENYIGYPSREQMIQDLKDMNIGFQPDKNTIYDWDKVAKKKNKDIEKYWLACKLSKQKGDISRINELPYADLWTISFCCQDISIAGKMKGLSLESGTRSSLLWENIRLLKESVNKGEAPKYLMFENVKNLVSKKFINDFDSLIKILDELGFNSYWKILNSCECGIPQNRQRVFVISIRKDIDKGTYDFPKPFDNGLRLKDLLENEVDEKYYINTERANNLIKQLIKKEQLATKPINFDDLTQTPYVNKKYKEFFNEKGYIPEMFNPYNKSEIKEIAPTLSTICGSTTSSATVLKIENSFPIYVDNTTPSGKSQCNAVYDPKGVSQTLCVGTHGYATGNIVDNYRIRKLTPRETGLLMGLTIDDVNKCIEIGQANTTIYKGHGNGIVTNCVELLFEHLYKAQYDSSFVCTDENFTQPQMV